jgi:predicted phosphodiesterase
MVLLHVSDLHFREGVAGSGQDPDTHLRALLIRDAAQMCSERLKKTPDAVLVSGDIAFAGAEAEYRFATTWLAELCQQCGTPLSRVFTVPGNHDVVRARVRQPIIQTMHRDIKNASSLSVDSVISGLLKDETAGPLLYRSIEPYNEFANQFLCSVFPPNRTLCERELSFPDGRKLRLIGVNSTFVSGESDQERSLFVDVASMQLKAEPGKINVVICHHPHAWLGNGDLFEDHLATVAQLHLFGHVHTNRIFLGRDFVRVAASATHPDRTEHGWEPGYNLIELDITGTKEEPKLRVRVHVRVFQSRPAQFRPKFDQTREVFAHEIALEPWEAPRFEGEANGATGDAAKGIADPGSEESMDHLRDISIRYFKLTASQRALVAGKLNLVEDQDKDLPDFERTRRVLLRAKDRDLVPKLDEEVRLLANANT